MNAASPPSQAVRTRFAPSPTGRVHIGNIRAAIYNWLFARHHGGRFLLRLEDTDRERSTPDAVRTVLEALAWLGLEADEEPVYQSSRREAHLEAAERLLSAGLARREDKGGTGRGACVVFCMPGRDMRFHDEIKGPLEKKAGDLADFVIVRSDGTPVFHLANVVDDLAMGVTHVIRGDDHMENTYRHVALYEALGAPAPRFAHLPMIVNAQGKPYAKRDGDVFVGDFRARGFLSEALFNYLVLLGWSPGDDREVLSRQELIDLFTLDRVQSKPAQFDPRKLEWMNGEHLKAMPDDAFRKNALAALRTAPYWNEERDASRADPVLNLLRSRVKRFNELPDMAAYFFIDDYPVDPKALRKRLGREEGRKHLGLAAERLEGTSSWTADSLESSLRALSAETGIPAAAFIHPLRVAVSGSGAGPGLFELLEALGRDTVLRRAGRAVAAQDE